MSRAIIHEQSLKKRRNSYHNLSSMTIDHESQTTNRKIRIHNVRGSSKTRAEMFHVPRDECKINYPLNRAGDRVREIQGRLI